MLSAIAGFSRDQRADSNVRTGPMRQDMERGFESEDDHSDTSTIDHPSDSDDSTVVDSPQVTSRPLETDHPIVRKHVL